VNRGAAAIAVVVMAASTARGDIVTIAPVCAVADDDDARAMLVRVLEAEDKLVVETGCRDTYELHVQPEGDGFDVQLTGPEGSRRAHANNARELPDVYVAAVHELTAVRQLAPPPRDVEQPSAPLWITELMFYGRGGLTASGGATGGDFAAGVRLRWGKLGFDGAAEALVGNNSYVLARAQAVVFTKRYTPRAFYFGLGGSLQSRTNAIDMSNVVAVELTAGWQFARVARHELFVEADLSIPLPPAGNNRPSDATALPALPATGMVSIGMGFEMSRR